jgi:hypothetical protein
MGHHPVIHVVSNALIAGTLLHFPLPGYEIVACFVYQVAQLFFHKSGACHH